MGRGVRPEPLQTPRLIGAPKRESSSRYHNADGSPSSDSTEPKFAGWWLSEAHWGNSLGYGDRSEGRRVQTTPSELRCLSLCTNRFGLRYSSAPTWFPHHPRH